MQDRLLLISDNEEDISFFQDVCLDIDLKFEHALKRDDIRKILATPAETAVFWDAENKMAYESVGSILPNYVDPNRLFAITNKSFANYDHLARFPVFGHHLVRRFKGPSKKLYSQIIKATLGQGTYDLKYYLPEATYAPRALRILRSSHKFAAVEALQTVLNKQGISGRISALVAQAADEFILNAIFDAPVDLLGARSRWTLPRHGDFALEEKEQIEIQIAATQEYMGISVTDQFGTVTHKTIMDSLCKYYKKEPYQHSTTNSPVNIGLYRILQGGISLLFSANSKVKTEAMIFFPVTDNYKDFRNSFHFLSTILLE